MTICDNCHKDVRQTVVVDLCFCKDCWPKVEAGFKDKFTLITDTGACWVDGCYKPIHGAMAFPYYASLCQEHFMSRDFKKEDIHRK